MFNFKQMKKMGHADFQMPSTLIKKLGINNFFSSQSPEQKLEIVKKETQNAPTLFMDKSNLYEFEKRWINNLI